MARYSVALPLIGTVYVEVEAESEEAAIEAALAREDYWPKMQLPDLPDVHFDEVDVARYVTRGNVCYHPTHEASAEEV